MRKYILALGFIILLGSSSGWAADKDVYHHTDLSATVATTYTLLCDKNANTAGDTGKCTVASVLGILPAMTLGTDYCPPMQLIDGHGATTNLTSLNVVCPAMVDNTGQSGANASVVWPTRANNQALTLSVATTVATTYKFEIDFGAAVAYPNGNHTTAYRYCGYAATNVTEGSYGYVQCRRSSTYGSGGIACDWIDGVGAGGCHN